MKILDRIERLAQGEDSGEPAWEEWTARLAPREQLLAKGYPPEIADGIIHLCRLAFASGYVSALRDALREDPPEENT